MITIADVTLKIGSDAVAQGNLLKGIDNKTVKKDKDLEGSTLCSLFSNTPVYQETKWFEIAIKL